MSDTPDDILSVLDRADLVQREAYDEITHLRAALAGMKDVLEKLIEAVDEREFKPDSVDRATDFRGSLHNARAALRKAKGETT